MGWWHQARNDVKRWNRNIKLFFLSNMLYQFGSGMFMVLYNLYIQALGYGADMNGSIVSIQSLATACMFIPIGLAGDRLSRKHILIIGALLTGLSFMGRSYAEDPLSLQTYAVITGLFISFYQVIAIPFLAENVSKSERLSLFSIHFSGVLAAQVVGSIAGGYGADMLQAIGWSKIDSLQTVLMLGGAATVASFLPLLFIKEKKKETAEVRLRPQPKLVEKDSYVSSDGDDSSLSIPTTAAVLTPEQTKRSDWINISQFTTAQLLVGLGSGLVIPYLNMYFTDRFAVSLTAVGLLVSLGQIMTIVSMLIGPTLVARVGQVRAVVIFQLLSLPFLLLTGFTTMFTIAAFSFLFRQALMNAANPIQSALMVERISDARRGIANSFTQTAFMLGWATMGPVQSAILKTYGTYWGYAVTFCITGILYITAAGLFYYVFRESKQTKNESQVLN
ncbi:MFS transporter [Paenibacillus sp. SC116]|uniref:MFS transporter n=1 Tax=Paenibacillus sp. SC116 TaxID=2968986 RepID=UPI00215B0279|nr:MFS transporter [Paenibacillus sp. SC116]MCR8844604.1 MFS transporter [Paenibacillus sp. SC116]